jgi:hypothetical protein
MSKKNNENRGINMMVVRKLTVFMVITMVALSAHAVTFYSNDFETNTNGFSNNATGVLPTNSMGGTSRWLGGDTSLTNTSVTLTLTGLTPGVVYNVSFDLFLGGTWDGSAAFGPDFFRLNSSSSGFLVNATFGVATAPTTKTQTYSDATPLGDGGTFFHGEGADVLIGITPEIYYFGHGVGNPMLSFTASGTSETLTFSSSDAQGISDEYFALDNVIISTNAPPAPPTPVPTLSLWALSLLSLLLLIKCRQFLVFKKH